MLAGEHCIRKLSARRRQPGGTLVGNFIYDTFNLAVHLWQLCKREIVAISLQNAFCWELCLSLRSFACVFLFVFNPQRLVLSGFPEILFSIPRKQKFYRCTVLTSCLCSAHNMAPFSPLDGCFWQDVLQLRKMASPHLGSAKSLLHGRLI